MVVSFLFFFYRLSQDLSDLDQVRLGGSKGQPPVFQSIETPAGSINTFASDREIRARISFYLVPSDPFTSIHHTFPPPPTTVRRSPQL